MLVISIGAMNKLPPPQLTKRDLGVGFPSSPRIRFENNNNNLDDIDLTLDKKQCFQKGSCSRSIADFFRLLCCCCCMKKTELVFIPYMPIKNEKDQED